MAAGAAYPGTMARPGRGGRYHHGDLRAALIDIAVEIIGERGVRGFSLAEASRRLGVASSAPYAHFAGRDDFLAAVAVHGYEIFNTRFLPEMDQFPDPAERLAAGVRAYVRFAGTHRSLFEVIFVAGLDKAGHPEVKAAEKPFQDAYLGTIRELSGGQAGPGDPASSGDAAGPGDAAAEPGAPAPGPADCDDELADLADESADLVAAVEAAAYGHAMLLLEGDYGEGDEAVELAAARAARATLALVESRHLLRRQPPDHARLPPARPVP
jgi:AcrR family transcriptional regulator